ncbi:MAG: hypothetical protein FJ388_04960 [Verrucomicrobia bacterium]|nr:hypothetical protein [Verrucomicrobiota bacterium]
MEEIIFAQRVSGTDHWYANFGYYASTTAEYPPHDGLPDEKIPALFSDGGRLCRLNLRTGKLTVLLDDPRGGVRDPQLHYDGKTILFSYRKGGQPYYSLYTIRSDGTGLTQLTDAPYDDIEPCWLPDGGIMFCSSRCRRFVNCHRTPVATLYRCDGDGRNVRLISANIEHDNTPWVLPDGRVLYMRWEYVDRSQFAFHHLWTTNPDGTGQMVFYGNQFDGTVMLDAKPIPGGNLVVASISPGHGVPEHMGYITIIDPSLGPDEAKAARQVSQGKRLFRDPYPISENCFLVADKAGLWVMDGQGNVEAIYPAPFGVAKHGVEPSGLNGLGSPFYGSSARGVERTSKSVPGASGSPKPATPKLDDASGPALECHEPRPLLPRPRELAVPPRVDLAQNKGRLFLSDVYHGRNMAGVKRGEIAKLLVLEQLPKPVNFSGGMWPTSDGGTFTLARILGTVPLASNGSAHFEVPAMRPVFFVALDQNDLSVKRMQSFVSVQPGETTGCVGCHESRLNAPLTTGGRNAFHGRQPDAIRPIADTPEVFDFPRDIQPILDRHCVHCHNPDRCEGRVDLSGDHTPLFSVSYYTLLQRGLISDGRNERFGNRPPRTIGSSASRLLELLDGRHYDLKADERDRRWVRLWIESSAVFAGTYAALGCGMYPVEFPVEAMERRCGSCHGSQPPAKRQIGKGLYFRFGKAGPAVPLVHEFKDLQQIRGSIGYYKFNTALPPQALCNLTRPEKSLLLRAPLATAGGGAGVCSQPVFNDTQDGDYRAMLAAITAAKRKHDEMKRFDMPGFRPNVYYVQTMQRYGILPATLRAGEAIDVYATDRAYWASFGTK